MRRRQHGGMQSTVFRPLRSWLPVGGMLAGVLAIVLNGFGAPRLLSPGALLRWQHAGEDWLLAADDGANQLVIYDATSGRPIRRLGAGEVGDIAGLAQRDGRIFVIGDDGSSRELHLPQLQRVARAER
jgi:hypothetical protein